MKQLSFEGVLSAMKYILPLILLIFGWNSYAQEGQEHFTREDSLRGFLFPERAGYDVHFYDLNIRVTPDSQFISGYNDIYYTVVHGLDRLQLDLFENMKVEKVLLDGMEISYDRKGDHFFIPLPGKQVKGEQHQIRVYYSGNPKAAKNAPWDGGWVWKKDKRDKDWIGIAVQGEGASLWWPNKDHLSEEPDSMRISCEVPKGLKCISNGRMRGREKVNGNYEKFTWFVNNPINNYNVSLYIADYAHFKDIHISKIDGDTLTLNYYVMPQNLEKAKEHFEQVHQVMDCFERLYGKYPFYQDGYKLIETSYLGMEHQSAIAYGNKYLPGYAGHDPLGLIFDYIIIHETGHEWFGNMISMADMADMWIHESFTTYSDALYVECIQDYETAVKYLESRKGSIKNKYPIIGPRGVNFERKYESDKYYKGAYMLHGLRNTINNDSIWFAAIRGMGANLGFRLITSEDVIVYFNKATGKNLTPIFDQYLRYARLPLLEYKLKQKGKNVQISYRWRADEKQFGLPAVFLAGDQKIRVQPTVDKWKNITLKGVKKDEIQVDTDNYLIKVRIVE